VARQPIFDRDECVHAYELLFRGPRGAGEEELDDDVATSTTIVDTFMEIGLDAIVGRRPAWVNVGRDFLLRDLARALPAGRVALEVLEDVLVDAALLATIDGLARDGYRIVLDDFVFRPELTPLVERADAVKLDVLALGEDGLRAHVGALRPFGVELVAEKVETREQLALCRELGFDYFQGYAFCRPEIVPHRRLDANRAGKLQLAGRVQDPAVEFDELETIITRDVSLSYRLLRYVNSAYFGLTREVQSVRDALVRLGLAKIRAWSTVLVLADLADGRSELVTIALVRARMCELIAKRDGLRSPDAYFTAGLLSVLDVLVGLPMEETLTELPLSPELAAALLHSDGPYAGPLTRVLAYERGSDGLAGDAPEYLDALRWAEELGAIV